MRVARTSRWPVVAATTALALSGCVQTAAPVAPLQPRNDLDSMAYGLPYPAPATPAPSRTVMMDSAITTGTLRASYAAASRPPAYDRSYHLDAGDKLRVVVFGQEGLTNTYAIDAGGSITMPLIGAVPARGQTPAGLAAAITAKLRNGYIREPSVAVEVTIAGGFSPRAKRDHVTLTHTDNSGPSRTVVPLGTPISPGDTVLVGERWF